jgi:hypothetical protein
MFSSILHPFLCVSCRSQELSKLNEKLRTELAEKDGTINTLTRAKEETVSLIFSI